MIYFWLEELPKQPIYMVLEVMNCLRLSDFFTLKAIYGPVVLAISSHISNSISLNPEPTSTIC